MADTEIRGYNYQANFYHDNNHFDMAQEVADEVSLLMIVSFQLMGLNPPLTEAKEV